MIAVRRPDDHPLGYDPRGRVGGMRDSNLFVVGK